MKRKGKERKGKGILGKSEAYSWKIGSRPSRCTARPRPVSAMALIWLACKDVADVLRVVDVCTLLFARSYDDRGQRRRGFHRPCLLFRGVPRLDSVD